MSAAKDGFTLDAALARRRARSNPKESDERMPNNTIPGNRQPGSEPSADSAARPFSDGLVRAQPASVGVDANELLAFLDAVEADGLEMHSLVLHRHGRVIAEGWRAP